MLLRFGSELFPVSCGALRSFVAESIVPIWTGACDIGHIGLRGLGWGGGGRRGCQRGFTQSECQLLLCFVEASEGLWKVHCVWIKNINSRVVAA